MTHPLEKSRSNKQGYKENIFGLASAKITARGAYPSTDCAITLGASVAFVLGMGGGISFTVTARVSNITPSTDTAGVAEISVSAESNGSFSASVT